MSEAPPAIRPAQVRDVAAIRDCAERAYAGYVTLLGRRPQPMTADFAADITRGRVWVAEVESVVAGALTCFAREAALFVESVAVLPDQQGRGIGRALLTFAEAHARDAGLARIELYTNARMTRNLALYPRLGYRETGRRVEAAFERVFFEKPLEAAPQDLT